MKLSLKKVVLLLICAGAIAAGIVACGKGVEFGAKSFVLTGASS